ARDLLHRHRAGVRGLRAPADAGAHPVLAGRDRGVDAARAPASPAGSRRRLRNRLWFTPSLRGDCMKTYSLLASLLLVLPIFAAEEPDHEIHQELRGILTTVVGAINSGNYDAMLPVISENVRATTITQEVISSRQEASAYFKRYFGPGGI